MTSIPTAQQRRNACDHRTITAQRIMLTDGTHPTAAAVLLRDRVAQRRRTGTHRRRGGETHRRRGGGRKRKRDELRDRRCAQPPRQPPDSRARCARPWRPTPAQLSQKERHGIAS
eukprot:gene3848-biopygen5235